MNQQPSPAKACRRCGREFPLDEFRWLYKFRKGERVRYRDSWCVDCRRAYKRLAVQRLKANEAQQKRLARSAEAREQKRLRDQAYYEQNKHRRPKLASEWHLKHRLRKHFGLEWDQYQAMRTQQDNRCAICGRPEQSRARRLSVDHDHQTGRVRALLCHHCNTGLGNFMDDPELLRAAIAYLMRYAERAA